MWTIYVYYHGDLIADISDIDRSNLLKLAKDTCSDLSIPFEYCKLQFKYVSGLL